MTSELGKGDAGFAAGCCAGVAMLLFEPGVVPVVPVVVVVVVVVVAAAVVLLLKAEADAAGVLTRLRGIGDII